MMERIIFKVLLIEGNHEDRESIKKMLSDSQAANPTSFKFKLKLAKQVESELEPLKNREFDIVLLGLSFSDKQRLGMITLVHTVAHDVPIIVFIASDDEAFIDKAMAEGAHDFLIKENIAPYLLKRSIRNAIKRNQLMIQSQQLSEYRFRKMFDKYPDAFIITNKNGIIRFVNPAAKAIFGRKNQKLIGEAFGYPVALDSITEIDIIQEKGKVIMAEMRTMEIEWEEVPAHLISFRDVTELKRVEQLKNEIREREKLSIELEKSSKRFENLSLIDSHTGLYNHRYLQKIIEQEYSKAKRLAHSISIMMFDIDYFKSINDVYGHQFGDLILKQFGKFLKEQLRGYDIIVRFGGEEFAVVCPSTDRPTTLALARRILDKSNFSTFGNKLHTVKLKFSIGVSAYPDDGEVKKGMNLIDIADKILNKAKEDGGNRAYSSLDALEDGKEIKEDNESSEIETLQKKIENLRKRSNQSIVESIFAFAKAVEVKDHYTGEHIEETVSYAAEIAESLGLHTEQIETIRQAAALHDLGKIGISDKILQKRSKLTKKEFNAIKKHPHIAADILRPIQFMRNITPLVLYHHERWDGKGYPNGLKKKEIPLGARIIGLADVYHALVSNRPYRKAYSKEKALKLIKDAAGAQFDPEIVEIFCKA